jgi:hypothetical protein
MYVTTSTYALCLLMPMRIGSESQEANRVTALCFSKRTLSRVPAFKTNWQTPDHCLAEITGIFVQEVHCRMTVSDIESSCLSTLHGKTRVDLAEEARCATRVACHGKAGRFPR